MHQVARGIIEQIIKENEAEILRTETAQDMSINDAREAEGAMISRYDTFLEEAQYLAGGQAKRLMIARQVVSELQTLLVINPNASTQVRIGSIVEVENLSSEEHRKYIIVVDGAGGGTYTDSKDGNALYAVSALSPIGCSVVGQEEGELVTLTGGKEEWEIIEIL